MSVVPRRRIVVSKGILADLFRLTIRKELIEGKYINEFEDKFADYIGVSDALLTFSGTAALSLILEVLPLSAGDEVILPAYTFPSIPACIKTMGFSVRLVDIDSCTDNLDIAKLKEAISSKTKVIIATHLFGKPCNIEAILSLAKRKEIFVIEDCAHAIGAKYKGKKVGSFGDAAFFSFSLTKPFNTFNGGMIVSNNSDLVNKIRYRIKDIPNAPAAILLRNICVAYLLYFLTKPAVFTFSIYPVLLTFSLFNKDLINTYNRMFKKLIFFGTKRFRYSNLQAFVGLKMLQSYEQMVAERSEKVKLFNELGRREDINFLDNRSDDMFQYFYVIKHTQKEAIAKDLLWHGVDTGKYVMRDCGKLFGGGDLYPNTAYAYNNSLQLPLEHCNKRKMLTIINVLKRYKMTK